MKNDTLTILGWREWVMIPEITPYSIKVKVDSGAKTSALHAGSIKILNEGEKNLVEFTLYPHQNSKKDKIRCTLPLLETRPIRSSNGQVTQRPVVEVMIQLGKIKKRIELTLINRELMGFRMLLGRQALSDQFVIQPSKSFCLGHKKKENKL